ncbi:MAG: sialidase family protein [Planctomycetota bacterium]|nr:sialidase family protein [Planctomycetota bacterium]
MPVYADENPRPDRDGQRPGARKREGTARVSLTWRQRRVSPMNHDDAVARFTRLSSFLVCFFFGVPAAADGGLRLSTFSADVTIPIGHRCMGVLPVKAKEVVDPLEARGLVLRSDSEAPVVFVSVDWCEIRNGAYERWRDVLAAAAGTTRERVLVTSVHQHDAPVADLDAEKLLAEVGLAGELCDVAFHERALQRVAGALREGWRSARRVTHVGTGRAKVSRVASNRRVVHPDGRVSFSRGSASGGDAFLRGAPGGLVDPWLRTVSFWNEEKPLAAIHTYATHPMSTYGRGGVSADFVGMARRRLEREDPGFFQIYASGASGDVTAGKYNDGSPANRPELADRLFQAMKTSRESTRRRPVDGFTLRSAKLSLEFHEGPEFREAQLLHVLRDRNAAVRDRILAAMGLASRRRLERPIDLPCLDFGTAALVLLPGEAFVGYQLMAQRLRPDVFVACVGYGECWPGYIPTRAAFADGFAHGWRWVAPGAEARVVKALHQALTRPHSPAIGSAPGETIVRDVYPATADHPRYSEGSLLELADGALAFATTEFAGGGQDHAAARIVVRVSADGGRTWGPTRVLQENVGQQNVMSVSLLRLAWPVHESIGMFYLVKNGPDDLHVALKVSGDELRSFGESIPVTTGPGYHVMNNDRVVRLLDGRLLCPVAWTRDVRRENHFVSICFFSDDEGRSWVRSHGVVDLPRRGAMEPGVVELRDGRLLMILRTQLGRIWASHSADRGESWSEATPWSVESPEAPATLGRIPSTGDLLLIWNPTHVPGAGHGGRRTPLAAAVSADEGRTWMRPRLLESSAESTYAYTSLVFHGERALMSYYVRDEKNGAISSRFRSLPVTWFYGSAGGER